MSVTLSQLKDFAGSFERRERGNATSGNGEYFYCLKDNAPDWMRDACREAHGADLLPDDFRYGVIAGAAEFFLEQATDVLGVDAPVDAPVDFLDEIDQHEFCDGMVDIYTTNLTHWMGSHLSRVGYVNEAQEEGLLRDDATIETRMMAGQYMEIRDTVSLLASFLMDVDVESECEA